MMPISSETQGSKFVVDAGDVLRWVGEIGGAFGGDEGCEAIV